jgi:DNA-directed RNA polymerase specialized sigma24 family protein
MSGMLSKSEAAATQRRATSADEAMSQYAQGDLAAFEIDTGRKAVREPAIDATAENDSLGAVLAAALAGGEELFLARETGALLVQTFEGLTKLQQEVFELVKLEGLSYQQAAGTLGITVPSVRMYAHRAFVALREAVAETPETPLVPA